MDLSVVRFLLHRHSVFFLPVILLVAPQIDGTDAIIGNVRYKDAFTQKSHPKNVEEFEENVSTYYWWT